MPACPTCGRHYRDADFVPGMRLRCACGRWLAVPDGPPADGARAHRCPSCGGAVPADEPTCPYCRSTLLTRACPACFAANFEDAVHCVSCGERLAPALVAGPGATRACARCGPGAPLSAVVRDDVTVYVCGRCTGAFVPHGDLDALSSGAASWPLDAAPGARLFREPRVRYLRCPFCDGIMDRRGVGRRRVVVDVCAAHGVWFDVGELTLVLGDRRTSLSRVEAAAAGESAAPVAAAYRAAFDPGAGAGDASPAALGAIVDRLVRVIEGLDGPGSEEGA